MLDIIKTVSVNPVREIATDLPEPSDIEGEILVMLQEHPGTPLMVSELFRGGGYARVPNGWSDLEIALSYLKRSGVIVECTLTSTSLITGQWSQYRGFVLERHISQGITVCRNWIAYVGGAK